MIPPSGACFSKPAPIQPTRPEPAQSFDPSLRPDLWTRWLRELVVEFGFEATNTAAVAALGFPALLIEEFVEARTVREHLKRQPTRPKQ